MQANKAVLILVGAVTVSGAAAAVFHFKTAGNAASSRANTSSPAAPPHQANASATPQVATGTPQTAPQSGQSQDVAETTANFLGTLKPGGTPEAAGAERNYVVTYQVAFLRKSPQEKLPEESMSYKELVEADYGKFAPYVFYGTVVPGKYDPAHPDSIAVRAQFGGKEVHGYIDSQKLWLEPPIAAVETPRYMALKDATAIHVVPDAGSPTVLSILQGEVVGAVGKLTFQGAGWIKARFASGELARFGFIQASDLQPLTPATVNQSALTLQEIPKQIRYSEISLADADRQQLSKNGFYIETIPPQPDVYVDDMSDAYRNTRYGTQYFVTSDLFLHAHHLIFDRMLQDSEEKRLAPSVAKLAANVARVAENELKALPSAPAQVRDAVNYDLLYFSVAAKLFDPQFGVPGPVHGPAEALVKSIESAGQELPSVTSSTFGDEDFTQYKVRGHYEKSDTLKRYFRGMMWFGRTNFLLSDKRLTLAAILIPDLLEKARESRAFETIDHLLGYLVGPQDKYTLAGYREMNKKIFGTETPTASQVSAKLEDNLQAYSGAVASGLPAPQIVSQQTGRGLTQEERLKKVGGFKFLGQRYTLDAFFLNQLSSPSVGSDNNPRNLPSALDVMMLLGSPAATEQQHQAQQQRKWANYDAQEQKLQGVAQEHLAKEATFYDEWLSAVNALYLPTGSKQFFALGKPWQYKNLNAGAASWTELKHDTILYAEQSAAEMGDGEEFEIPPYDPPKPKGYVEPNPEFFRRQGHAIDQMLDRLKHSEFITDEYLAKFTTLRELAREAESIAQKEVDGSNITAAEYERIGNLANSFGRELLLPEGAEVIGDASELQMALVADIATDAVYGLVLEVGTGTPQRMIAVVKDAYGGTRLTVGYVYSWYEFASKKRWSDSEWKKVIYSGDSQAKKENGIAAPSWYSMFLKNAASAN